MRVLILLIFSIFSFSAIAQIEPSVALNTSGKKIQIGEQILVEYILKVNAQDSVQLPLFSDTLRKEIEIIEISKIDTTYDEADVSIKKFTQTITITSFDSGYFAVKPFVFRVNNKIVESEPFLVEVQNVALNPQQEIKDIKSPFEAELTFLDYLKLYWHYLIGALILSALIVGIFWYFKTREKPIIEQIIQKPKIPPHLIALEKLEELKAKKLWQSGDLKGYYSSLTTIIREYIELRYQILALEQTTPEILEELKIKEDISNDLKIQLKELLQLADLVKFAKLKTIAEENEKLFVYAKQFVEQTKNEINTKTEEKKQAVKSEKEIQNV